MTLQLQLRNVCVERSGISVLNDVSLELSAGERLAVIGQNGAGKTTLLRAIVGLQTITAGEIIAFGVRCQSERDFRAMRVKCGYLFQDPDDQLFCPTVLEDVAFGPLNIGLGKNQALARAHQTLGRLGLEHLSDRITHRLSGGEKRLVSLASVLAMDPEVLLLDEPSNALDENHLAVLTALLSGLATSMIIVSHDRDFIERIATRAVMLDACTLRPAVVHRHPHTHDHIHFHTPEAVDDHNGERQHAVHHFKPQNP